MARGLLYPISPHLWPATLSAVTLLSSVFIAYTSAQQLTESDILVRNSGITVPFGRTMFLDPSADLILHVRPGDKCVVTVLTTDALSQRPGKLSPSSFPCNFQHGEVEYTHFGIRTPLNDKISLQIRYDSADDTYIIPLFVNVDVEFIQLELVTRNMPIDVPELLGSSNPIDSGTLAFEFDRENEICKVSVLSSGSGRPKYGKMRNDPALLSLVDCDQFLTNRVTYQHTDPTSPNRDHIPMVVELLDRQGNLLKQEYFQVLVKLREAAENTRPHASAQAMLVMEGDIVDQFVMTALTPDILAAEDSETPPGQLIFNITKPLGPGEGFFVSTDDRNQRLKSFYQKDIEDLKIAYKPPSSDSDKKRVFVLEFQIVDSDGLVSDPVPLIIEVRPMNTLAPVATTNKGIQLFEGQSRRLASHLNLEISDENNLEDVRISVAGGLRHGDLRLPGRRSYFTPADLDGGRIIYQHDDSDTTSDNIIFKMTDGKNDVEFLFPVTIYPVDDDTPILTVNTGLEIRKNELIELTDLILSATDLDSNDDEIRFVLEPPYSKEGVILKRQYQMPDDTDNWDFSDGVYERVVDEFTQRDINEGKIFYRHVGPHRSDFVIDRIKFRLVDTADDPNQSDLEELVVKIQPVDDQPPYPYPNTPLALDVNEFQLTEFRRRYLRYTDDDSDDRRLQYIITSKPFDTDDNTPMSPGKLVLCDGPDTEINDFNQAQVNHLKICYQPPSAELGVTQRKLQFKFDVMDVSGNVVRDQLFTITLRPIDNKPPVVINKGAQVLENSFMMLTPQMLEVQDEDTDLSLIRYIVIETPEYGILRKDGFELEIFDEFTPDDVSQGKITYISTGQDTEKDQFKIDVTDGVHQMPTIFRISVKSYDDKSSEVVSSEPGALGVVLEVAEGESIVLHPRDFKASETEYLSATFLVQRQPYEGAILRNGRHINRFTHANLLDGIVEYQHTGGEVTLTGRNDSFTLMLTENSDDYIIGGNKINKFTVDIDILPKDTVAPVVNLNLDQEFAVVESKKAPILPNYLDATDIDTPVEDIVCTIVVQPTYGYIENISPAPGSEKPRIGMPISAFSIKDIRDGKVNYVQSVHKGVEPREDRMNFRCSDGENFSPNFFFPISIYPFNDEEPVVSLYKFLVLEGMTLMIDLPILNAVDSDEPPDQLRFHITKTPIHGRVVQQNSTGMFPVTEFTIADISGQSTINYEHDDSETTEDQFDFILTDGVHNISKAVPIIIHPVDDETPRLTINNGLEVEKVGITKLIDNYLFKAEDLDSFDPNITFVVKKVPRHGILQYVIEKDKIQNLTLNSNFTQHDIDEKRIQYVHTGQGGIRDLIKFDVTDGLNPLIDRYFYVTVEGIDTIYPNVINKGVELPEGGSVVLSTDILGGSDINTPDENLIFTVTRAPSRGHLERVDRPGVPITSFTQLDLAANRIKYVHSSPDEMKMDSFEFEVTDGYNPVARTFRISLSDVDNKKPVLMFQNLRIKEGSNKLITPFELRAEDRDTDDSHIVFTITQLPIHGNILYNTSKIVTSFTMADLNENVISYQHDGTETISDSFSFTVTDGTHSDYFVFPETTFSTRKPLSMNIEIFPVDNGVPQLSVNRGASSLRPVTKSGDIGFPITSQVLKSTDRDSPVESLEYRITSPAKHGFLINVDKGDELVSTWTQADLDHQSIQYRLSPGVDATSDNFFFEITDEGGNVLSNQPFHLNWAWVSLESDTFVVNETSKRFEVVLHRRGYLGETTFVTITVENDTAKVGEDVSKRYANQVQFNPGQTEKTWYIHLVDDKKFEGPETLKLKLSEPVMAVLENPKLAKVTIMDKEDESTVYFPLAEEHVAESIGEVMVSVKRNGDLQDELMVICTTIPETASGTLPTTVTSFSDYITRPDDYNSIIRFDKGETEKHCRVMIIDDSLYEEEENFYLILIDPMGGRVGDYNMTSIVIEPDKDDKPAFYFGNSEYVVDESDGFVEVKVWRTGTDLSRPSSVTVRSRRTDPVSAEAGLDYIAVNNLLDFAPGVTRQTVKITVLDDLGRPQLEGDEKLEVVLRSPTGATLGEPSKAVITITDSQSDLPRMQFKEIEYEAFEDEGKVTAYIVRYGDITLISTVRCYTRQATALVEEDYKERPNTDDSVVTFQPGEREKACVVEIKDDNIFEEEEEFKLFLGTPSSPESGTANVGDIEHTVIKIKDPEDKPQIKFEKLKYTVKEPMLEGDITKVRIPVIRTGDLSEVAVVRVHTKDGSARAGKDYNGISRDLIFSKDVSRHVVEIDVLYDGKAENTIETFSLFLKPDFNMVAEVKKRTSKVTVAIEEMNQLADVTFPEKPIVVSLRDYDNVDESLEEPTQGYPLICITSCNPKHPKFHETGSICGSEGVNDTATRFRWRVSAPSGRDGVTSDLRDSASNTFFTDTKSITLDSIYFGAGSRVQCVARAVNTEGLPGKELASPVVTVSKVDGICVPRIAESVGAEPFTAKLRYTGTDDEAHPNKVRLSVTIPHRDGMLPAVSMRRLSNFELTLSPDGTRVGIHRCSNLLDYDEVVTGNGFLNNLTKNEYILGEVEPYQYSSELRSDKTLRFYRNLDLEACMWEFVAYFDMSELVSECGGKIQTDGQVLNLKQSYVSLSVPLYVSYIFHSPVADGGWQNSDMQTKLNLMFVYDTAILWQDGISGISKATADGQTPLKGLLYPTSMRIQEDGRLAVDFRTVANFRGQFVLSHPGMDSESLVLSPDKKDLPFEIKLVRSEPTFEQPEQTWQILSKYAVRDYSGTYTIKLIPCMSSLDQEYLSPGDCTPQEPVTFDLPIRFQQVSDPVATKFSLNTDFRLMKKQDLYTADRSEGLTATDVAFTDGDKIYGRIDVDPVQNLGGSFFLNVEKVFLCSGKDGYIPKYDPDNHEYGCVDESSTNLEHSFKIVDKGAPYTVTETFRNVPFNSILAVDDKGAIKLAQQPGSDGFTFDSQPLFKVDSGRQWFIHAIYTVRSKENAERGIGKRSADYHAISSYSRSKRAVDDVEGIGESEKGTNMARLVLDHVGETQAGSVEIGTNETKSINTLIPILVPVAVLMHLLIGIVIVVIFCRRRKKKSSPPVSPTNTITVVAGQGKSRVVHVNHLNNADNTEV